MVDQGFARLMAGVAVAMAALWAPVAGADTIRTRAPQEHIDAFMANCKAKDVATASCTCMLRKLSETPQGDAALDVLGLLEYRQSEADRKAGMVPLLNRHGMRASELKAAVAPDGPVIQNVVKQCN